MNKIFIRADATKNIGTGHVMRCLALAQEWKEKNGKAVFLSYCETDSLIERIKSNGIDFVPLDKQCLTSNSVEQTLEILDRLNPQPSTSDNWVAIDGYHFDADYQKRLKKARFRLLWIDDYGHATHYYADIVLNQNISANTSMYNNREQYTRLLLGTEYSLLRREFWLWEGWKRKIPKIAQKVLVTLGGADPENVTLKVIKALKNIELPNLEAKILLGPSNPHYKEIEFEIQNSKFEIDLIRDTNNMPQLMSWADIAVSASGSTCLELAFMGLPSILIVLSHDQEAIARELAVRGVCINLGNYKEVNTDIICQALFDLVFETEKRIKMSVFGQNLVDGKGSSRVVEIMSRELYNL